MMQLFTVFFFLSLARAEGPFPSQDPLCDSTVAFGKVLDQSRATHLQSRLLRPHASAQTKWFRKVSENMRAFCAGEKKFAAELLRRDRSSIDGQCKPAAETALYDQELLEHSEKSLSQVTQKLASFFDQSPKNKQDSLWATFEKNHYQVNSDALELGDVPRIAACELRWIYPRSYLEKKPPFDGCLETPPGIKLDEAEKSDPGVFGRMKARYQRSIQYHGTRRDLARSAAEASRARYESCIASFPGAENIFRRAGGKSAAGAASPTGKRPHKASDITGISEDNAKRKK